MAKVLIRLLCLLISLPVISCVSGRPKISTVPATPDVIVSETRYRKEYVWVPGDQIEVTVRRVPEVSRTVVVRPDGFISLPLVNEVKAAGLTASELKANLTNAFSQRLISPEVTVIALQVPPPMVYVIGEVNNNTAIPIRNAPTASAAIAFAGGYRRSAKPRETTILRLGEDGLIRAISVGDPAGGQPGVLMGARNFVLQPDDIIFVPESGRSQVTRFLDDFVNRPLSTASGLLGLYVNFRWLQEITK